MSDTTTPAESTDPSPRHRDAGRHRRPVRLGARSAAAIITLAFVTAACGSDESSAQVSVVASLDVQLTELAISGDLVAEAGDVNLVVTNAGSHQHDLVVEQLGEQTRLLNVGDSETLPLESLGAGSYTLFCSVPGHRESGMETELIVGNEAPTGEAAAG